MKHVGFTGTRKGMSPFQKETLRELLHWDDVFHHGDCRGADAEAAEMAAALGMVVEAHPCDIKTMRAHAKSNFTHPPKPPLVRNKDIVDACSILIAAPLSDVEVMRSGTWATIRYARSKGKRVIMLKRRKGG